MNKELCKALEVELGHYLPHLVIQVKVGDLHRSNGILFSENDNVVFFRRFKASGIGSAVLSNGSKGVVRVWSRWEFASCLVSTVGTPHFLG